MNGLEYSILIYDIKQRADTLGWVVDWKYKNKYSIEWRDLDPHLIAALEHCQTSQDIREYLWWYAKCVWWDRAPAIEQILYNKFRLVETLFSSKEIICRNDGPWIWYGINSFDPIKALWTETLQQIRADICDVLKV